MRQKPVLYMAAGSKGVKSHCAMSGGLSSTPARWSLTRLSSRKKVQIHKLQVAAQAHAACRCYQHEVALIKRCSLLPQN